MGANNAEKTDINFEDWGKSQMQAAIANGRIPSNTFDHLEHVNENVIQFASLTQRMVELYSRKNRDYGDSFNHSLDEDGLLVSKIRLGDKISRFNQLVKLEQALVTDESIEDTLMDLANYAVMTIQWLERQQAERKRSINLYADGKLVDTLECDEHEKE